MQNSSALCFAITGHPNEGKSSVVSTLAEDDSVRISPFPGETKKKQIFPFRVDGTEILRFIDTPGFQRPGRVLEWLRIREGKSGDPVSEFLNEFRNSENFADEIEIFESIAASSGIIYVADCSKPLRSQDRFEMEILRLTGRPRMAILNSKDEFADFVKDWKNEFMRNFNSVRVFNAHKALWIERLELLEALRLMDQSWSVGLGSALRICRDEKNRRISETAVIILDMLDSCISYRLENAVADQSMVENEKKRLSDAYRKKVSEIEKQAHSLIRSLFRHRVFDVLLSDDPEIESEDLFSKSAWKVLGLSHGQLAAAGGAAGASVGVFIDIAAHGTTMGAFTAIGAVAGVAGAWLKGEDMVTSRAVGKRLGKYIVKAGPCKNPQLMYVLADRALIYFYHIIARPHGLRDNAKVSVSGSHYTGYSFLSRSWDNSKKKIAADFFSSSGSGRIEKKAEKASEMEKILKEILSGISENISEQG